MNLLDIIRTWWPIAAFVTPFILAGGFAWLKNQFPTKLDLEKLRTEGEKELEKLRITSAREIAELSVLARTTADAQIADRGKIDMLMADVARRPSKVDLSKDIGKLAERVGRLESSIASVSDQLRTNNGYLHTLIDKHIS
ncbi:hypothetical protein QQS45_00175 [Alteriqipengyuania flavescens]|uniref:hypothetical protein n=1 Tax=Alteriqipengyuania flavescens TaxID=3053610 RepID=UPI0025B3A277|nr:hypothetical protein [Alteriqipengyuania flavescens]WJY18706.1 hypothetical protein QQW98_00175 [Alteriqipengyuania flavescens]WJY24646.1 hypothetical protein QQS45_00175 [Alteriqipengyuania flavescens]